MTSESITGWFLRSPGRKIWRANVEDWLLWALFSVRDKKNHSEWEDELDYYITAMGEYVGYPLRYGTNSAEMQCLRLTMDPVHMVHRPFVWYMVSFPLCTLPLLILAADCLLGRYLHFHRALLSRFYPLQCPQVVSRLPPTPVPCTVLARFQGHRDQLALLVPTPPLVYKAPNSIHPWHRHRSLTLRLVPPRDCHAGSGRWHPRHRDFTHFYAHHRAPPSK